MTSKNKFLLWLIWSADDIKNPVFWRDVIAEGVATFIFTFINGLAFLSKNVSLYQSSATYSGLNEGFLVFFVLESFMHIGGAHINPSITLGFLLSRGISLARAVIYILSQMAFGLAGYGWAYLFAPAAIQSYQPFSLGPGVSVAQGVGVEATLTFCLITTLLCNTDVKNKPLVRMPSLPIGLCVACCVFVGGYFTGACMNPVLATGPAVFSRDYTNYWIYWVAPLSGSTVAAVVYQLLMLWKNRCYRTIKPSKEIIEPYPTTDGSLSDS